MKKTLIILGMSVLALCIISCKEDEKPKVEEFVIDSYPLDNGNFWLYDVTTREIYFDDEDVDSDFYTGEMKCTVLRDSVTEDGIEGKVVINKYGDFATDPEFMFIDDEGLKKIGYPSEFLDVKKSSPAFQNYISDMKFADQELLLYKFPVKVGQKWDVVNILGILKISNEVIKETKVTAMGIEHKCFEIKQTYGINMELDDDITHLSYDKLIYLSDKGEIKTELKGECFETWEDEEGAIHEGSSTIEEISILKDVNIK